MPKDNGTHSIAVWTTVVVGTMLSLWACTRGNTPTSPTTSADHGQPSAVADNIVRGAATVGPGPVPVGPSSRPVGPTARPVGPSARPIGPSATPVGGGTPPPTATPTPSGPPPVCTPEIHSSIGPYVYPDGGGGDGPEFIVPSSPCKITAVRVQVRFTSNAPLDQILVDGSMIFAVQRLGAGPIEANIFVLPGPRAAGAMQIGSTCDALEFVDGAPSFDTATPPFDGTFSPAGSAMFPGSYGDYIGKNVSGTWNLATYFTSYDIGSRVTLECWRVEFDVAP